MSEEPITFKRIKKKPRRQPLSTEDDDDNIEEVSSKLCEMRELQELRKKPHGVNVIALAIGKKISIEDEVIHKDPFKIQTGGLLNMNILKSGKIKQVDDAYDTGIGTQFSVETNKRDEDEEMMKFIEEKLNKTKKTEQNENSEEPSNKYTTPEEAALQAVPTHLRESTAKKSEEMLSNQMLCGIPEIDLGIEAKIRNIEATEEAKLRLLNDNKNKNDGPSQFVPTNIAVNFVQHNKSNAEQKTALIIKTQEKSEKDDEPASKKSKKDEKATDDYHFEKFKKQFKRH
ncbi:telomere length and silencing protein 1 homolog isoform X1 [Harmonia axyridis]|uniref:telomere length and silencing protein 1 homolog isoform X1 n=1 Tax=Harmonia axyridis TaxID=115357 RepID=UPI001E2765B0|nr:telomere length and silencing protein 1 homolog isoform X1 [Harmonia axyridis]